MSKVTPAMRACTLRRCSLPGLQPLEAEPLPPGLVSAYLERLGVERPSAPSLEALGQLLSAHVDRIAYENIDVKLGRPPPDLDAAASARRVAVERRGGYCFILVDAFSALLCSLGFVVSLHTAACAADPPPEEKWGDHVVAAVHFGEEMYVADVGLGEGPRSPFRVASHKWYEDGFEFSLEERGPGVWYFSNPGNVTGSLPGFTVDFSSSASSIREFARFHHYFWSNPDSAYVSGPVVAHRKTFGRGVLSLIGCGLRRTDRSARSPAATQPVMLAEREAWFSALEELFALPLQDLSSEERDALWSLVEAEHAVWMARRGTDKEGVLSA